MKLTLLSFSKTLRALPAFGWRVGGPVSSPLDQIGDAASSAVSVPDPAVSAVPDPPPACPVDASLSVLVFPFPLEFGFVRNNVGTAVALGTIFPLGIMP